MTSSLSSRRCSVRPNLRCPAQRTNVGGWALACGGGVVLGTPTLTPIAKTCRVACAAIVRHGRVQLLYSCSRFSPPVTPHSCSVAHDLAHYSPLFTHLSFRYSFFGPFHVPVYALILNTDDYPL